MKLIILTVLLSLVFTVQALNKETDCKCRIASKKKIVNGRILQNQNSYPWIATLKHDLTAYDEPLCSATIINENYLITAGHCIESSDYETLSLVYLEFRGSDEKFRIDEIITHPNYNRTGFMAATDDIALYKLRKPLNFTDSNLKPACLGEDQDEDFNRVYTIVGYGNVKPIKYNRKSDFANPDDFEFSKQLREGDVDDETKTDERCEDRENKLICVDGQSNICLGETGSGLHHTTNGKTVVVGISSMPNSKPVDEENDEICSSGAVFSRLSYYMQDFIKQHVGDDYCV